MIPPINIIAPANEISPCSCLFFGCHVNKVNSIICEVFFLTYYITRDHREPERAILAPVF